MGACLQFGTRAVATLGFFFGSVLFSSALAHSAETIPLHAYSAVESQINIQGKQTAEQSQPRGTRVYYYDYYSITYGPNGANSALVLTDTTFHRDHNGVLYATDIASGVTSKFPPGAKIERENNLGEIFVRPGEVPNDVLRRLLSVGGARFVKILTGSPQAEVAPLCPQGMVLGPDQKCGPPPPRWTGGGPGTINGLLPHLILTALSNSCALRNESIVSFSYTVPNFNAPVTTSLCGHPSGSPYICPPFGPDAPGSSHNRYITYVGGGDVVENLGFHSSTVNDNNAASGTAPGCFFQPVCS